MAQGIFTLLLVEDDDLVRTVTEKILRGAGYEVLSAASGAQALSIAAAHDAPIDLVVTDVVMPGMNGRALVETLRSRVPGLRALFVSGYTQDVIDDRDALGPGTTFLGKPFTQGLLLGRVRALLDEP